MADLINGMSVGERGGGSGMGAFPKCRSCGHWRDLEEGWGVCQLTQVDERQQPLDEFAMAYVYGPGVDEEAALMTWAHFGCNRHTALIDPTTHEPVVALTGGEGAGG